MIMKSMAAIPKTSISSHVSNSYADLSTRENYGRISGQSSPGKTVPLLKPQQPGRVVAVKNPGVVVRFPQIKN
ncbi:hypothetical protein LINPERPRIM_LOCUS10232 [Linum perenne]